MAYLRERCRSTTLRKAGYFLDSVQIRARRDLRLSGTRARPTGDNRHRPVVPDVSGLEARSQSGSSKA